MKKLGFEIGSGNIFADIGSRNPDEKLLRAQLLAAVGRVVKKKRLSQSDLVALTGLKQPEVSKLVNGHFTTFSADRLAHILSLLGYAVRVSVLPLKDAA